MLSEGLVKRGHNVTVVTTVPHYPSGTVSEKYQGFRNFHTLENGVNIIRIALPSIKRSNLAYRFAQFLCYQFRSTISILTKKFDVVLAANPSLWVWMPFFWSVKIQKTPAVYSVYDVYPDVGIALGIFRHRLVINTVTTMETFCLREAKVIHILADAFRPGLKALGVNDEKMNTIYAWVETSHLKPLPKTNDFSQSHNFLDKFILMYAGNMGYSQGLEHLIEAAKQLEAHKDIQFVLVGDGPSREKLMKITKESGLSNIVFLPFQPRSCLPELMASADISFVSQLKEIGKNSIPSKIFSIMASGRPLLACVDEESESKNLICRAEAGICVELENTAQLAMTILKLKEDRKLCETLGRNGRMWVEAHHSPEYASERFEGLLCQAIKINELKVKSDTREGTPERLERIGP